MSFKILTIYREKVKKNQLVYLLTFKQKNKENGNVTITRM